MTSVKTSRNKKQTPHLIFLWLATLSLGPKQYLHSKGLKNTICLWLRLSVLIVEQCRFDIVQFYLVSAKDKLHFQYLWSEGIFSGTRKKFLVMKSWSSEVVSDFWFGAQYHPRLPLRWYCSPNFSDALQRVMHPRQNRSNLPVCLIFLPETHGKRRQ